jgi:hypothetical protein
MPRMGKRDGEIGFVRKDHALFTLDSVGLFTLMTS